MTKNKANHYLALLIVWTVVTVFVLVLTVSAIQDLERILSWRF